MRFEDLLNQKDMGFWIGDLGYGGGLNILDFRLGIADLLYRFAKSFSK